jgi:hypothetical protein
MMKPVLNCLRPRPGPPIRAEFGRAVAQTGHAPATTGRKTEKQNGRKNKKAGETPAFSF